MGRLLLVVLALASATFVHAEEERSYESNFGRVILAKSDYIVLGVASGSSEAVGDKFKTSFLVQETLYGEDAPEELTLFFTGESRLAQDKATRGLFALSKVAKAACNLVGKPVAVPQGDLEEKEKVAIARAFIDLEAMEIGKERTGQFLDLIWTGLEAGGYGATNAAVELLYVVKDRPGLVTIERYNKVREIGKKHAGKMEKRTIEDLELVLQGMVEARIKKLVFKRCHKSETAKDKLEAAELLLELQTTYPSAFVESDAKLAEALADAKDAKPKYSDTLVDLAKAIRLSIRERDLDKDSKGD